ncbi:MAG: hypothetical protein HZA61_09900 [Candidatus Eisenbacteria bacterium]|uniref:Ig-like domain-containing protein n=1 Tax=Eiseniibacteriota bacterium TaxID=2212470 RepID=A0A933SCE6_UNCEI|nr:hypothetical protein [Candidatus Eisenbacteria bacterium]
MPFQLRAVLAITATLVALLAVGCEQPTAPKPQNHPPVVHSIVGFPPVLVPGDSAIVVCSVTDADGDTLIYDWYSNAQIKVPGEVDNLLENTRTNVMKVFTGTRFGDPDTGVVTCVIYDRKGGAAMGRVFFLLTNSPATRMHPYLP